jgi:hypothetical protein
MTESRAGGERLRRHVWFQILVYGGAVTLLVLALCGLSQVGNLKAGGLDEVLSNAGCYGGGDPGPYTCGWARLSYTFWFWPAAAVGLFVLIAAGVAWVSEQLASPESGLSSRWPSDRED